MFLSPHYLLLFWLIPLAIALFWFAAWRRRKALARLADSSRHEALTASVSRVGRFMRALLLLVSLGLTIVALARPTWGKTTVQQKERGRDVVFVLDISRSMLAPHRSITRLEEARFAIQQCLRTIHGDRIALVIFAGNAKIACPLTHDYAFFLSKLNDVDYRSVAYGGTMLGDALRLVCNGIFKTPNGQFRDVILITDGEDMESDPVNAAKQLPTYNARLIAVGLGNTTPEPLVIKTPDGKTEAITDNGSAVMTRLDAKTLQEMTSCTPGGVFIPVPQNATLNLDDIYQQSVATQIKQEYRDTSLEVHDEKYPLFLALAIAALVLSNLVPEGRKSPAALVLVVLLCAQRGNAQAAQPQMIQPIALQQTPPSVPQAPDMSQNPLCIAAQQNPTSPYAVFNAGTAYYTNGLYDKASESFAQALALAQQLPEKNPKLESVCHSGIAACNYAKSKAPQNPEAVKQAQEAMAHCQTALEKNPLSKTAYENLNAAKLNYKQLRHLQQTQQQQKQSGDKNQKNDDQKQNEDQKSQQQKQDLQQLEDQMRQASKDLKDNQKNQQELNQQQQQLEEKTKQALDKEQKQQTPSKSQQFLEEALKKQQETQKQQAEGKNDQAAESQKQAADMVQMARQTLDEKNNTPQDEKQENNEPEQPQDKKQEQPPEAKPNQQDVQAMDILNQEEQAKQERRRFQLRPPAAHSKDW